LWATNGPPPSPRSRSEAKASAPGSRPGSAGCVRRGHLAPSGWRPFAAVEQVAPALSLLSIVAAPGAPAAPTHGAAKRPWRWGAVCLARAIALESSTASRQGLYSSRGMADPWTKTRRFQAFLDRLRELPAAASQDEAWTQVRNVLDAVEDEHSGVPYDSSRWHSDGRMYAPDADSRRGVPGHPRVIRYRSRAHNTFLGRNGAIEIRSAQPGVRPEAGDLLLTKPGADGRSVWQQQSESQ